jgi:hypothetical protein
MVINHAARVQIKKKTKNSNQEKFIYISANFDQNKESNFIKILFM